MFTFQMICARDQVSQFHTSWDIYELTYHKKNKKKMCWYESLLKIIKSAEELYETFNCLLIEDFRRTWGTDYREFIATTTSSSLEPCDTGGCVHLPGLVLRGQWLFRAPSQLFPHILWSGWLLEGHPCTAINYCKSCLTVITNPHLFLT